MMNYLQHVTTKLAIKKHRLVQKIIFNENGAIGKRHRLQNFILLFQSSKEKKFCYLNSKTGHYEISHDGRHFIKLPLEDNKLIENISDREYTTILIPHAAPCVMSAVSPN
jgi:hypothetical protein